MHASSALLEWSRGRLSNFFLDNRLTISKFIFFYPTTQYLLRSEGVREKLVILVKFARKFQKFDQCILDRRQDFFRNVPLMEHFRVCRTVIFSRRGGPIMDHFCQMGHFGACTPAPHVRKGWDTSHPGFAAEAGGIRNCIPKRKKF